MQATQSAPANLVAEAPKRVKVKSKKDGKEYVGTPHVDFRTFLKWKQAGFKVKKGSKSCYTGLTFLKVVDKESGDIETIPKAYHLFHSSQVEQSKK